MTGRPLRPVTDHRLGKLLPHQLANRTQAPPLALPRIPPGLLSSLEFYAVLAKVSLGCPPLKGKFLRVPHPSAARRQLVSLLASLPLDLHVLGVPPAFNLSQDQTLHFFFVLRIYARFNSSADTLTLTQVSAHIISLSNFLKIFPRKLGILLYRFDVSTKFH